METQLELQKVMYDVVVEGTICKILQGGQSGFKEVDRKEFPFGTQEYEMKSWARELVYRNRGHVVNQNFRYSFERG
jgi:hypothetical protein